MHIGAHILVACCAVLMAGLAACLGLFFALKLEIAAHRDGQHAAVEGGVSKIQAQIAGMEERLRQAEERAGVLVAPSPPRSGLNLNKRAQALRMFRRGESPDEIAACLSLPRNEVRLLVKVHRIAMDALAPDP
jgi:hypothetical protein